MSDGMRGLASQMKNLLASPWRLSCLRQMETDLQGRFITPLRNATCLKVAGRLLIVRGSSHSSINALLARAVQAPRPTK